MLGATQLSNSEFLSQQGIRDLMLNATILVLVAIGQAMVVITRNVDLSVGSVLGSISAFAAGSNSRTAATRSSPSCWPWGSVRCSAWSTAHW